MMSNIKCRAVAAAATGALLVGASVAGLATAAPAKAPGGTIHFWVTPGKGAVDKILVTGAIGDFGTATSITKSGKVDQNGNYVKVAMRKGGFEVNAVAFDAKAGKQGPTLNKATCSAWTTIRGTITVFKGTGAYAGIGGTLTIQTSYAIIGPLHKTGPKKGECNLSDNAAPVAQFSGSITGAGKVTF
jgi:hypothetical protein